MRMLGKTGSEEDGDPQDDDEGYLGRCEHYSWRKKDYDERPQRSERLHAHCIVWMAPGYPTSRSELEQRLRERGGADLISFLLPSVEVTGRRVESMSGTRTTCGLCDRRFRITFNVRDDDDDVDSADDDE